MTNIEHIMLSMCFGMNIGWLIGSIIILITDGIKTLKQKHKMKKEQQNTEVKGRTGDNQ